MFLDRLAAHLATAVSRMNDLCPSLLADLPFVRNTPPYAGVFVQHDPAGFSCHFLSGCRLVNDKPFLEISFAPIEVGLILGSKAFLLEFASNLAAGDTVWEAFHHFNNSQM